jgi:hypothetical protein
VISWIVQGVCAGVWEAIEEHLANKKINDRNP